MFSISLLSSPEPKARVSFIGQNVSVVRRRRRRRCLWRCRKLFTFSSSSPEPLCQFQPTWHKASFGEGIQVYTNKGPHIPPRRYNSEIVKIIGKNILKSFSKPLGHQSFLK